MNVALTYSSSSIGGGHRILGFKFRANGFALHVRQTWALFCWIERELLSRTEVTRRQRIKTTESAAVI